ncbi:uncharacterized protein BO72DRAFT_452816 [Aspergillus fijiensis CBS 313.89]|uniref:Tautomerase cis-CaaD-like domain-containing protein n=1 Tax=Aspergillus fijiensis CBS 313.89 TaxID=1448319 RepID=A0A8G1RIV4_9EURO|nr:uncharacterized protein BO72DRAFT_452816 [Aspergillus fijiensis CBS 313.89]RAK72266.1 hypothetical protein BO72DRAFT_452816 [Aspergillus fijiensis CBS 313.89]
MPLYEIEHSIPLDKPQRDALAQAITHIHTRQFTTPTLFVNIKFVDARTQHNYVAGRERSINRIIAYVRTGGSRTHADFEETSLRIAQAWDQIVNAGGKFGKERELSRVFVMGAIVAGLEHGVLLPRAGEDGKWLAQNTERFQELAEQGDEDFRELVEEIKGREDLRR